MNKLLLKLAIAAAAGSMLSSNLVVAQLSPATPKSARVRITQGAEVELAKEHLTITTNDPGGSPEHYGIVHYGKSPITLQPITTPLSQRRPMHER